MNDRCGACHGDTKQRGGLALHTPEAISQGGDSGPVFVAGKPEESEIVRRLRLPVDDDDHMPPENKPQPTEDEIKAIERWIAAGATFGPVTSASAAAAPAPAPVAVLTTPATQPADEPAAPDLMAVNALRDHLVHVEAVITGSNRLRVNFAAAAKQITDPLAIKLIEPVLPQLESLSLARCAVGDETARLLARAPRLARLDLRSSRITDAGLATLSRLATLRELVLAQTKLTDAAAEHLAAFSGLQRVYLWKTGLTGDAIARLRQQRPQLQIDVGDSRYATTQQAEPEIKLTSDAPIPGAGPVTEAAPAAAPAPTESQPASALKPINTLCPVSGKPIDARYTLVHEGRVIGFCCPNCPGPFWAEPAKFESKLAGK